MIDFNRVPDEDLYGMCLKGDEDAWRYIYNFILHICQWRRWNLKDKPELAQATVFHLINNDLNNMRKCEKKNKFRNFIKWVTINKIKDCYKDPNLRNESLEKKGKDSKGEEFTVEYPDHNPSQELVFFRLEVVSIIDSAIEKLPPLCRRIIREYLNFKAGLYESYAELSKVLKMPIPTISSKVSRCLAKLVEFKEIKELNVNFFKDGQKI